MKRLFAPYTPIIVSLLCTLSLCSCSTINRLCTAYLPMQDGRDAVMSTSSNKLPGRKPTLFSDSLPGIIIESNEIYGNNRGGMRVRGSNPLLIRNCNLYMNGRSGLRLEKGATASVEESAIYLNGTSGVDLLDAKRVEFKGVSVFKNLAAGFRIRTTDKTPRVHSCVSISDTRVFLNGQAGVFSAPAAGSRIELDILRSEVFENKKAGIRIEGSTILSAQKDSVFSNGSAGISVFSRMADLALLDVFENKIFFNQESGILVNGGVTGEKGISNNWIYNNYKSGIASGLGAKYRSIYTKLGIFHNTIVANGSSLDGAGIRIDNNGTMEIENNIIVYNFRTGIMTYHCGDASHNLLFANGQIPAYDPERDYAFLIRRYQYGGCPASGSGDILKDPLFKDPDDYDFTLFKDSPAIGAAKRLSMPYFRRFHQKDMGPLLLPGPTVQGSGR